MAVEYLDGPLHKRHMRLFVGVLPDVELGAQHADVHLAAHDDERNFRVSGHFEIGLTVQFHLSCLGGELLRKLDSALGIEPYLRSVFQDDLETHAARRLDALQGRVDGRVGGRGSDVRRAAVPHM